MKRSLCITFFALLGSIILFSESAAQQFLPDTARIAFVTSDRTAILAKKVGVNKVDTLFAAKGSIKLRNMSVLASTRDGKSLLIAGYAIFINPASGVKDSAAAFARIDSPFTNTGGINPLSNPVTIGGAKILKVIFSPEANFTKTMPLGVLTSDGNEWYGTWCKAQAGNGQEWFYHGNFSGVGPVDTIQVTGNQAAGGGYHMTNLVVSEDNKTMLTVIFDQIISDQSRAQLISWTPSIGGGNIALLSTDFTGLMKAQRPGWNIDSSFAFYFRVLPQTQLGIISAELALEPINPPNKITLYQMRIINAVVNALTSTSRQLLRSSLPAGIHFFTGFTGNPGSDFDDKEVITPTQGFPGGNGGDMMSSFGGDSLVLVTCRGDDVATAAESGIYIYDLRTNIATLVQNDPTRMERQPIFMGSVPKLAPPPPYKDGTAFMDKKTLDFGQQLLSGPPATLTVTLKDPTSSLVNVISAAITGVDAANFSLSPNPAPATVLGHSNLAFPVKFSPNTSHTYNATLTVHYQDSLKKPETDSILTVALTGIGTTKIVGVHRSSPSAFDLSVVPNPFTLSTQITVTAQEAGMTSVEIRDLLGRDIYSSKTLMLGAGEKFNYTLDASALHLAPGEYFVLVRSAGEEVTRKVIYVK